MMQVGSQHRSTPFKMKAMQRCSRLIGKVYLAKGLCFKRRPSIGHKRRQPHAARRRLGPVPRPGAHASFQRIALPYNWHWFWDTGNGDIGNQGVHEMGIARWGLGDPEWPKPPSPSAASTAYDGRPGDAQHAARRLRLRRRELMFEVRGNADRRRRHSAAPSCGPGRRGDAARRGAAPPAAPPDAPPRRTVGPASNPLNVPSATSSTGPKAGRR